MQNNQNHAFSKKISHMLSSMTGYGSAQCDISTDAQAITVQIELRSVNSRFLDLHIKLPEALRNLEPVFRKTLNQNLLRGKVECKLIMQQTSHDLNHQSTTLPCQNTIKYLNQLETIVLAQMPNASPLSVMQVLNWPGVLQHNAADFNLLEHIANSAIHIETIEHCLHTACQALHNSKRLEGHEIAMVLHQKIEHIKTLVTQFSESLPEIQRLHAEKLSNRTQENILPILQELTQSMPSHWIASNTNNPALEQRLREELAILCTKSDVSEELDRIQAHCSAMLKHMHHEAHTSIGKSLDFLCQELNREANTIASKSHSLMQTELALDLKHTIEQIREQVQNIE